MSEASGDSGMHPGPEDVVCPYGCVGDPDIERGDHERTLVGSLRGTDPNHHWLSCRCRRCGRSFTKEWKRDRVCYSATQSGKLPRLLRRAPVCFEEYENDPRAGQCRHLSMSCEHGRWRCNNCGGTPGTPSWVPWSP
jgi:hypothetical protein